MNDQPNGYIKLAVSIPILDDIVDPDDLPTAEDVIEWLTDEYRSPCGLVADFDDYARATLIVTWVDGQAARKWTAAGRWQQVTPPGPAGDNPEGEQT